MPRDAIAQWLPTETLIEVIEALSRTDQLTFCRLSKLFHNLCLPLINRVVVLRDYDHAKTFLERLLADPSRAVKLMVPQLEHLSISPSLLEVDHGIALQLYTFPRLLSCLASPFGKHRASHGETQVSVLAANSLGAFLERHPGLTHLRASHHLPLNSLRIHLPNLRYFHGGAAFIPAIMTHKLREARLYWSGRDSDDFERTVAALHSMTDPDIPFVSMNDGSHGTETDDCTRLVEALATHMPNIICGRPQTGGQSGPASGPSPGRARVWAARARRRAEPGLYQGSGPGLSFRKSGPRAWARLSPPKQDP
ncbi:hypothetical protein GGX14DRAFT_637731 [Mycena pura]|uniref:F-box domain-containing protein n=1 Tax=Mycena pura TaxID=153505 RepID=A0AAD6VBQ8_9AGAR|nr:hypothetical protein GGX14DRAFT_637731 [Mycena pura]